MEAFRNRGPRAGAHHINPTSNRLPAPPGVRAGEVFCNSRKSARKVLGIPSAKAAVVLAVGAANGQPLAHGCIKCPDSRDSVTLHCR